MADINKIEVQIKTGPNAPDEHTRIFLGFKIKNMPNPPDKVRSREFRLRKENGHANPFTPNTTETLIFGAGANVANKPLNDPRNPQLDDGNIIGAYIHVSPESKQSWKILGRQGGQDNTFVTITPSAPAPASTYHLGGDIILQEDAGEQVDLGPPGP